MAGDSSFKAIRDARKSANVKLSMLRSVTVGVSSKDGRVADRKKKPKTTVSTSGTKKQAVS